MSNIPWALLRKIPQEYHFSNAIYSNNYTRDIFRDMVRAWLLTGWDWLPDWLTTLSPAGWLLAGTHLNKEALADRVPKNVTSLIN